MLRSSNARVFSKARYVSIRENENAYKNSDQHFQLDSNCNLIINWNAKHKYTGDLVDFQFLT